MFIPDIDLMNRIVGLIVLHLPNVWEQSMDSQIFWLWYRHAKDGRPQQVLAMYLAQRISSCDDRWSIAHLEMFAVSMR